MNKLTLREAKEEDCRFLFELRNDETVRKQSFQTSPIPYEEHVAWFQKKRESKHTYIFILELNGRPIGRVQADVEDGAAEISYALCEEARGHHYSQWMITQLEQRMRQMFRIYRMSAKVKEGNIASRKIFLSLGYDESKTEYGYAYEKEIPAFTIMMCTYHSEKTLPQALDSILCQDFPYWELRILDNGSDSRTVELLGEYQRKDRRIHCTFGKKNVGWAKGISILLEKACGTYAMFLGADDCLATSGTLAQVTEEGKKHWPDIVFTGCEMVDFEEGHYRMKKGAILEYKVFEEEDKLTQFYEIMRRVYYNSVMHYMKTSFLKENGIDFYAPFYKDSQSMTEAIARAKKIVVMDKVEYILHRHASQTAGKVDYYLAVERQWRSVKNVLPVPQGCDRDKLKYVAGRILLNLVSMNEELVSGNPCVDRLMNPIEVSFPERFRKSEEWLSSEAMGEMLYYGDKRLEYGERMIGTAGVLYMEAKKYKELACKIKEASAWMADFAEAAMCRDEKDTIQWKKQLSKKDTDMLKKALQSTANPHRIGCEVLLKPEIVYEDERTREQIRDILKEYLEAMCS